MNRKIQLQVLRLDSFSIQSRIREVEVFFSTPYDVFEGEDPRTLIIFSFRGSRKLFINTIDELANFFSFVFALAKIDPRKFPQSVNVDEDNHTIALSRNGEWTDDDYQKLCILMEAVASVHDWTFRYNESRPHSTGPLFKQSMKS